MLLFVQWIQSLYLGNEIDQTLKEVFAYKFFLYDPHNVQTVWSLKKTVHHGPEEVQSHLFRVCVCLCMCLCVGLVTYLQVGLASKLKEIRIWKALPVLSGGWTNGSQGLGRGSRNMWSGQMDLWFDGHTEACVSGSMKCVECLLGNSYSGKVEKENLSVLLFIYLCVLLVFM